MPSFVARSVQTVVSPRWLEIVPFTMLICVDVEGDIPVTDEAAAGAPSCGSLGMSSDDIACMVTWNESPRPTTSASA